MKKILITGVAGFIGSSLAVKLLNESDDIKIVGIDNMSDYYDIDLKKYRLNNIKKYKNFKFVKCNIANKKSLDKIFLEHNFDIVINLAAQAGVRYSIVAPDTYIESNIVGFYNILEACRKSNIKHLIFASSSSIYGNNKKTPFSEDDKTDSPVSLYAATKKSDELLAYSYSKLYDLNVTGLRFFTAYGPAGRPDMAYFSFTNKLVKGEKIQIYNHGKCIRDFTYIDDITEAITKVINKKRKTQFDIYNIGASSDPVNLMDFVYTLKDVLISENVLPKDFDITKYIELVEKQKGDVDITYSDNTKFEKEYNFLLKTSLKDGLREFAKWYKNYYK